MHRLLDPDRLHLSVDGLILTIRGGQLTVLLSRRDHAPYADAWALPGRLVDLTESAEDAARALLTEMLPGVSAYSEQLYTFTRPDRDPRGRVASVAYLILLPWERLSPALAQPGVTLQPFTIEPGPDGLLLTDADGQPLSPADLAFDHGTILQTGVTRLQGKIDYTDVGFHLLTDMQAFSLSELQTVFEAVLDQTLDASNFRRGILAKYESTGRLTQTSQAKRQGRGRPAALDQFTP